MMGDIFIRTASGLANAHLFYNSEFIVYCESHPDTPEAMSWDLGFWTKIVNEYQPNTNITFKPQGGKSAIIEIANRLADKVGHRSICCVDRDFSDIHQNDPKFPYFVQTHGYAFENDICDPDVISSAIDTLMPGRSDIGKITLQVTKSREELLRDFRWAVIADQTLSVYFQSLFDREAKKYKSMCDTKGPYSEVTFSRKRAIKRIQECRGNRILCRPTKKPTIDRDIWRRMLGHLCWWLNFRVGSSIMNEMGYRGQIPEDHFAGACMNIFSQKLKDRNWYISGYYEEVITPAFQAAA